ncbi:MAG: DUF262 domain-containing protein [Lachnospiraceae bacterium]|nr:DUF262 domain-containing protein [Lachnospiraceae bacterium]
MAQTMNELLKEAREYEDSLLGIETEDTSGEDLDSIPYSADDIRITPMMYSVYQIFNYIEQGLLILRPEYQRNKVWDIQRKSLLIESLMLRIPIPAFYFQEDYDGNKMVIDGLQRLSTIHAFMKDEFRLERVQYRKEFEGCVYSELPKKYKMRIQETQLSVNVLDSKCNELVKFDVFRRVNTGGVPLNAQEIRNIMATKEVRALLVEMSECSEFQKAIRGRVKDIRMDAQELCLRYILFCYKYDWKTRELKELQSMAPMMDMILVFLNKMNTKDLATFFYMFKESMKKCYALLGEEAFSKESSRHIINKPLFISWSVVLTYHKVDLNVLEKKRKEAVRLQHKYFAEGEYYNAITSSTTTRKNLRLQFEAVERILEELGL